MQAANVTPLQFVYGPSTSGSIGALTGPNTAGAVEIAAQKKKLANKKSRGRTSSGNCACLNPWCGRSLDDEQAHRVPSGSRARIGRLWIDRVQGNRDRGALIKARLDSENADVRIHRCHFYPIHLTVTATGRVQITRPSEFNVDPKFRSEREIREDAHAPRLHVGAAHSLTSATARAATKFAWLPSTPSSPPSSQPTSPSRPPTAKSARLYSPSRAAAAVVVSASARKRARDAEVTASQRLQDASESLRDPLGYAQREAQRNNDDLAKALAAAEESMLLMAVDLKALEAKVDEYESMQGLLSWKYLMDSPDNFPLKAYTGFASKAKLSAFYNLLNHDGVCDRLHLYRAPDTRNHRLSARGVGRSRQQPAL